MCVCMICDAIFALTLTVTIFVVSRTVMCKKKKQRRKYGNENRKCGHHAKENEKVKTRDRERERGGKMETSIDTWIGCRHPAMSRKKRLDAGK